MFSIARAKSESSNFKEQVASIVDVIALDDLTIQIVTAGANPILPEEAYVHIHNGQGLV